MTDPFDLTRFIQNDAFGRSPWQQALLSALVAVLGFLIIWAVLRRLLIFLERRMSRWDRARSFDEATFRALHRLFLYVLIFLTGAYLIRVFDIRLFETAFYALMILLLAGPLVRFLGAVIGALRVNVAAKTETRVDNIIFDLLDRFAGFIIYATAAVLALDVLGFNVMPFIAGAGVAGLAIGFAAKDTLSNLIAGVLLIIDRPFEMGDRIEVWRAPTGSATWGDVIDIGIRATKIRTTDNIVVIIPNNEIMKRDILNYTLNSDRIRVRVNIGVAYDADVARAKQIITEIAAGLEWALTDPPPKVVVRHFGESAVELQLRVWIRNARKRMDTISTIMDQVKTAFSQAGIRIPYPRREITIVHGEPQGEEARPSRRDAIGPS